MIDALSRRGAQIYRARNNNCVITSERSDEPCFG